MDSYSIDDAIELVALREERLEYLKGEQMPPALIENGERLVQDAWQILTNLLWQNDKINLQEVVDKIGCARNIAWGMSLIQQRVNERLLGSHADELLQRVCELMEEALRAKGIDPGAIPVKDYEEIRKQHTPELYELWRLTLEAYNDFQDLLRAEEEQRLLDIIRETYPEAFDGKDSEAP